MNKEILAIILVWTTGFILVVVAIYSVRQRMRGAAKRASMALRGFQPYAMPQSWSHLLTKEELDIIMLILKDERSFSDASRKLGIPKEQLEQMFLRALSKISDLSDSLPASTR